MTKNLVRHRHAAGALRMVFAVPVACLMLALSLVAAGCGDDQAGTETTAASAGETTATTAATAATAPTAAGEEMGWSELADAILDTWAQSIQELNALLEGQPDPATVRANVEALKEGYIQKFVAQGKIMAVMSAADKTSLQNKVSAQLGGFAGEAWYTTYMDNWEAYSYASGDVEFTNLLAAFNILTQYADFELLKTQLPEEAARLGVE